MPRKKLEKISAFKTFPNTFEGSDNLGPNWYHDYFQNDHPITLELACGWGEYTIALAQKFPRKNFIGVDIKGVRLWKGAKFASENQMKNAAFLRCDIEKITTYFRAKTVDEIWITFPDPHPKKSKANKRLTSTGYLKLYREILNNDGLIHLKTDNETLFDFTVEILKEKEWRIVRLIADLKHGGADNEALVIKTKYEEKYLQQKKTIKYICFRLNQKKSRNNCPGFPLC